MCMVAAEHRYILLVYPLTIEWKHLSRLFLSVFIFSDPAQFNNNVIHLQIEPVRSPALFTSPIFIIPLDFWHSHMRCITQSPVQLKYTHPYHQIKILYVWTSIRALYFCKEFTINRVNNVYLKT